MQCRAHRLKADRRLTTIARGVHAGKYQCSRRITVHIAVEEAQWRGDHFRSEVVVHRHGRSVQRLGIELRVSAAGECDLCKLLWTSPVVMEVALRIHRHEADRGNHVVRGVPLPKVAAIASHRFGREGADTFIARTRTRLCDGAKNKDVATQSGGDRHRAIDHPSQGTRALITAPVPVDLKPECGQESIGAHRRKAVAVVIVSRPAGDTVDVLAPQAGIGDRLDTCIEAQPHG